MALDRRLVRTLLVDSSFRCVGFFVHPFMGQSMCCFRAYYTTYTGMQGLLLIVLGVCVGYLSICRMANH